MFFFFFSVLITVCMYSSPLFFFSFPFFFFFFGRHTPFDCYVTLFLLSIEPLKWPYCGTHLNFLSLIQIQYSLLRILHIIYIIHIRIFITFSFYKLFFFILFCINCTKHTNETHKIRDLSNLCVHNSYKFSISFISNNQSWVQLLCLQLLTLRWFLFILFYFFFFFFTTLVKIYINMVRVNVVSCCYCLIIIILFFVLWDNVLLNSGINCLFEQEFFMHTLTLEFWCIFRFICARRGNKICYKYYLKWK